MVFGEIIGFKVFDLGKIVGGEVFVIVVFFYFMYKLCMEFINIVMFFEGCEGLF